MIENYKDHKPIIPESAFVHNSSVIIGRVKLGENVSIWPMACLRADIAEIVIGNNTNIQDLAALHINFNAPVVIDDNVTVGHSAVIHGTKIGNGCLIGMNALVMECEIGAECIIAGGSVVAAGKKIPPRSLVMGVPGKIVKTLTDDEIKAVRHNTDFYVKLAKEFKERKNG